MRQSVTAVLALAIILLATTEAMAFPDFKKMFEERYVKPADDDAFTEAFKTASCNTCHVKGKRKGVRNSYGDVLAELIPGNGNARIVAADNRAAEKAKVNAEAMAAIKKAESMKAPDGGTWGEMFKALKLPPAPEE